VRLNATTGAVVVSTPRADVAERETEIPGSANPERYEAVAPDDVNSAAWLTLTDEERNARLRSKLSSAKPSRHEPHPHKKGPVSRAFGGSGGRI
jgi:hypothetical protein